MASLLGRVAAMVVRRRSSTPTTQKGLSLRISASGKGKRYCYHEIK
ncbi:hypothetical protein COLO4_36259 [Corchorus olitorius]|uniref:Uncharacterized protein n=1 Tax=Corchorus olitorius TaxID=93759 RepID=A0A1R3GAB6_9ROSI|nr:hypothetical protein COLO4_36259 [Corchorus olitorius]